MTAPATVPVSEVFGPVWQGEGPYTGRVCAFVRLGLCNLSCSWCDTPYTWDRSRFDVDAECPPATADELRDRLRAVLPQGGLVILSGGEPLMHQRNEAVLDLLDHTPGYEWHVETNGTIRPTMLTERVAHFTVSPKLEQGDPEKKRLKLGALAAFADLARQGRAVFKMVCRNADDVRHAASIYDVLEVPQPARWVMPEGVEPATLLAHARQIDDVAAELHLNLSLRQHTLMYGTERAR